MGVLRILGRGTCLDGIEELSFISNSKMDTFFHLFTKHVVSDLSAEFIKMPSSAQELAYIMNTYAYLGFPGCIGSFDVVHIAWDKCPHSLVNLFTGKEVIILIKLMYVLFIYIEQFFI